MATLILADKQDITRMGLQAVATNMYSTIHEADSLHKLSELLLTNSQAAVVIDYTLLDCQSEQLLILKERFSQSVFILFSDTLNEVFLRRMMFSSTTFSVVMKDASLSEIILCLKKAAEGERYVSQRIRTLLNSTPTVTPPHEISPLTPTEKEILKSMSLGRSTKEIANERFLSIHTVMTHRKNIFRKLQVNNAHEAVRYALRAGIVDSVEYYI